MSTVIEDGRLEYRHLGNDFPPSEFGLIPETTRKFALLDIIFKFGSLSRLEVTGIANEIYNDIQNGEERRTLADICASSGLINIQDKKERENLYHDSFLSHVVLVYNKAEMEFDSNNLLKPQDLNNPNTDWRTSADYDAGGGPARPILKDLYELEHLELLKKEMVKNEEIFGLKTPFAESFAEAMEGIVNDYKFEPNSQLHIGEYAGDMRMVTFLSPVPERRSRTPHSFRLFHKQLF